MSNTAGVLKFGDIGVCDVLVVGAGMAGVCAAASLRAAGWSVRVLDKGRGVGGRMATRRVGGATFDHGAQFVTARGDRLGRELLGARAAGVAVEWCRGFGADGLFEEGHTRWRGEPGMSALPRHWVRGVSVELLSQVLALRCDEQGWSVELVDGRKGRAGAVILTAPVPQSLALLDAGGVALEGALRGCLERIEYERCLAVMAVLAGPSRVPPPGGYRPEDGPIAWIADNQQKGISAEPSVTIHATDAFSRSRWDGDRRRAGGELLGAAEGWLGADVLSFEVHGWRYSKPLSTYERSCVVVEGVPPLILAGDAFGGARVEGAALSGWAAAEALLGRGGRGWARSGSGQGSDF